MINSENIYLLAKLLKMQIEVNRNGIITLWVYEGDILKRIK